MRGNPSHVHNHDVVWGVYPRVCGGTACKADADVAGKGLSPRMRGNPHHLARWKDGVRSIPAYAGEPGNGNHADTPRKVYPRVCGGTAGIGGGPGKPGGLSPRMRGNQPGPHNGAGGDRSIPAYAGEPPLRIIWR